MQCGIKNCTHSAMLGSSMCSLHAFANNQELYTVVGKPPPISDLVGEFVAISKRNAPDASMADKYPKYYKRIPKDWNSIDVYGVCKLFPVTDDTGCIHHALKKLLVPGVRTGGKSFRDDIKEARDTLTRWLELNPVE